MRARPRRGSVPSSGAWSDHKKKLNDEKILKICKSKIYACSIFGIAKNRILIGAPCPGGVDVEANGCAVDGDILGVSGPQNPKNSSIWIEKRLRNGSGTARETAEFRPSLWPALLLEVVNDRGESHFHRTRHRGGQALPVPGCPEGRRFPRHSILR